MVHKSVCNVSCLATCRKVHVIPRPSSQSPPTTSQVLLHKCSKLRIYLCCTFVCLGHHAPYMLQDQT